MRTAAALAAARLCARSVPASTPSAATQPPTRPLRPFSSFSFAHVTVKRVTFAFADPALAQLPAPDADASVHATQGLVVSGAARRDGGDVRVVTAAELRSPSFFADLTAKATAAGAGAGAGGRLLVSRRALQQHLQQHAQQAALAGGAGAGAGGDVMSLLTAGPSTTTNTNTSLAPAAPATTAIAAAAASILPALAAAPSAPLSSLSSTANEAYRRHLSRTRFTPPASHTPTELADGQRAWIAAAGSGDVAGMTRLLEDGALTHAQAAAARHERGGAAIHHAAAAGHVAAVEALVQRWGVAVDTRAHNGSTALHWAAGNGQLEAVEALLALGADPAARTATWGSNVFGKASGQTPLHWAAESGWADCVALLHAHAPALVGMEDEKQVSPLELARKDAENAAAVSVVCDALADEYVCLRVVVEEATVTAPVQFA